MDTFMLALSRILLASTAMAATVTNQTTATPITILPSHIGVDKDTPKVSASPREYIADMLWACLGNSCRTYAPYRSAIVCPGSDMFYRP